MRRLLVRDEDIQAEISRLTANMVKVNLFINVSVKPHRTKQGFSWIILG